MIVIAGNSPLSALAEIGMLEVLPALYDTVVVPATVCREAMHERAPEVLRKWMAAPPSWLHVLADPAILPEFAALDAGEAAALSLAWQHRPDALVIVDDRAARRLCEALAIRHTGAAGVLMAAAMAGLVDFDDAMRRLQGTSFHLSPSVVEELRMRLHRA